MAAIDIIVPVYNVEKYLTRCVDSLLNQTFNDIRILLIDDGSTDSSPVICDRYAAEYENVEVVHKPNGGQSSARNVGLGMVNAEYVMFLDSDDYFEIRTCEKVYRKAEEERADVVAFEIALLDKEGKIRPYDAKLLEVSDTALSCEQKKQLFFCFGHIVNKLYRHSVLEGVSFPEGLILEDYYWGCVIANRVNRWATLKEALYCYCENPNSTTHAPSLKHKFDKFKIMELVIKHYRDNGLYEDYYDCIEYLYTMFCFVNGCKSAILGYDYPDDVIEYARKMIRQMFPNFWKNTYYKTRNGKKEKVVAFLLYYFPRVCIVMGRLKRG